MLGQNFIIAECDDETRPGLIAPHSASNQLMETCK